MSTSEEHLTYQGIFKDIPDYSELQSCALVEAMGYEADMVLAYMPGDRTPKAITEDIASASGLPVERVQSAFHLLRAVFLADKERSNTDEENEARKAAAQRALRWMADNIDEVIGDKTTVEHLGDKIESAASAAEIRWSGHRQLGETARAFARFAGEISLGQSDHLISICDMVHGAVVCDDEFEG